LKLNFATRKDHVAFFANEQRYGLSPGVTASVLQYSSAPVVIQETGRYESDPGHLRHVILQLLLFTKSISKEYTLRRVLRQWH
jgi:hypothetical protein